MRCEDCAYFWQDRGEDRSYCHWQIRCAGDVAPCEEEDFYEDDDRPMVCDLAGECGGPTCPRYATCSDAC